jgi:ribosomal protein S18 acetylase RimI-like enzyme
VDAGIELRPAAPTEADAAAFARFVEQASDGLFRTMLGSHAHRVLGLAYRRGGHDLSWEHVTFAVLGGGPVGMLSAYSGSDHAQASEDPLLRAAGWRVLRLGLVALAARPVLRFIENVPLDDFYVQAVAVDTGNRGSGIGSMLLAHAEEQARADGSRRLCLDADVSNDGAVRLYERLGLEVESTSRPARLLGGVRVQRMAKVLG